MSYRNRITLWWLLIFSSLASVSLSSTPNQNHLNEWDACALSTSFKVDRTFKTISMETLIDIGNEDPVLLGVVPSMRPSSSTVDSKSNSFNSI